MTRDDIDAAVAEAKWFIARAEEVLALMREYQERKGYMTDSGEFPMQSGALKRASLDLTRSLAKMRRHKDWEPYWG